MIIDAIPGTWWVLATGGADGRSETKPKKYVPISAGQYVDMRLNATYSAGVSKLKGKIVY